MLIKRKASGPLTAGPSGVWTPICNIVATWTNAQRKSTTTLARIEVRHQFPEGVDEAGPSSYAVLLQRPTTKARSRGVED